MKLKLNREYAQRHLFVTLLLLGIGCWFGYDGFARYPATDAADLYREIEHGDPGATVNLEKFKRQKIESQYGFCALALLSALVVGLRLYRSYAFDFTFDENGFSVGVKRHVYSDIVSVDRRRWQSKGILALRLSDKSTVTLDSWHHVGVRDFESSLTQKPAESGIIFGKERGS